MQGRLRNAYSPQREVVYHSKKAFLQIYNPFVINVFSTTFDNRNVLRENEVLCRAGVTQLVECDLAKVDVAGSNPVSRSKILNLFHYQPQFALKSGYSTSKGS
jgi:hypothetical protein